MNTLSSEYHNDRKAVEERVGAAVTRFKKYVHVLPSGRTLKIVEYNEDEFIKGTTKTLGSRC